MTIAVPSVAVAFCRPQVLDWIQDARANRFVSPKGVVAKPRRSRWSATGREVGMVAAAANAARGGGMLLYQPWPWVGKTLEAKNVTTLFAKLVEEVARRQVSTVNSQVAEYAQYLRAEGRSFAIATARTGGGSFDASYNYTISIPNARPSAGEKTSPSDRRWITRISRGSKTERVVNQNIETFWSDRVKADLHRLNRTRWRNRQSSVFGHKTGLLRSLSSRTSRWTWCSCNQVATAARHTHEGGAREEARKRGQDEGAKAAEVLGGRPPRCFPGERWRETELDFRQFRLANPRRVLINAFLRLLRVSVDPSAILGFPSLNRSGLLWREKAFRSLF